MGGNESVVAIPGGTGREDRLKTPEAFRDDSNVQVRVATDAVGEGINLQRAHHMANDDLPWSPNRLQQRFGRIHRIGQTEVCQLWTRVAEDAREGDVYRTLLEKLEPAAKRSAARCSMCSERCRSKAAPCGIIGSSDQRNPLWRACRYQRASDHGFPWLTVNFPMTDLIALADAPRQSS